MQFSLISINIISDVIITAEDIWFMGDNFLVSTLHSFQTMRTAARLNWKPVPYIYEQFNVTFAYINQTTYIRSTAARILNALIETLNRKNKLPTYIVIVVNKDLLANIGYFQNSITGIIERMVNWLVRKIHRMINIRVNNLL